MKWRLWYGEDKKTDIFLQAFFLFYVIVGFGCSVYMSIECYIAIVIDGEDLVEMILLCSPFVIIPICYAVPNFLWQISKYSVDMNGIVFKFLFIKRVVQWNKIKAVRIFTFYQKGTLKDGEFIVCVMNVKKVPEKLTVDGCYFNWRGVVAVRATPERLKEFSQFCPVEIKYGKQTGNKCTDTFEEVTA